jgi:hypothetical protein
MDEGPCQKVHSDPLKADFQKCRDIHMFDSLIEREFTARIAEAERVIKVRGNDPSVHRSDDAHEYKLACDVLQKARARVEEEKADETINPEINPDILRIHAEMSRVIGTAEAAGIEGNIDLVQVRLAQKLLPIKMEQVESAD